MPTLKLTDPKIKSLDSNGKNRVEYYDSLVGGLVLRVTKTGHKSFAYRYRSGGNSKRFTIGKYPTIKLSDARKRAKDLAIQVSTGVDPLEEKQRKKRKAKPVTVEELAESFIKNYVSTKKPSTQSSYKSRINSKIVPHLGSIPVKDLSKSDVKKLLEKIALKDGKGTNSNRVHAILSKMLGYATEKDWIEINFMPSIKKVAKEVSRDRFYADQEIKRIWEAFEKQEEPMQSLLKMLLISGQRLGETRKMKWSDLSKDNVWTIQAEGTKAGRTHTIPLPDLATSVLEKLRENNSSDYVFESTKKKGRPLKHFGAAMERIRDASEVEDFRNHDLRRTVATNLAELKYDRTIIGKVLNHAQTEGGSRITAIYDRYDYLEEKKRALDDWNRRLSSIVESVE